MIKKQQQHNCTPLRPRECIFGLRSVLHCTNYTTILMTEKFLYSFVVWLRFISLNLSFDLNVHALCVVWSKSGRWQHRLAYRAKLDAAAILFFAFWSSLHHCICSVCLVHCSSVFVPSIAHLSVPLSAPFTVPLSAPWLVSWAVTGIDTPLPT